jgi:hypothetical protein
MQLSFGPSWKKKKKKKVAEKNHSTYFHSINFPYFVPSMTGHRGQYNTGRKDAIYMPDN